jgi:hypothetical protein
MNNKSVGILIVSALVLAAGAAVVVSRSGGDKRVAGVVSKDGKAELLLPKAREQMGRIAKVRIKRGAVETVLESREIDGKPAWVVASKGGYPAESDRVRRLIGELLEATVVEAKTAKPELYERIGVGDVDKPGSTGSLIELSDAEGNVISGVIVGNASQAPAGGDPALQTPRYFVRRSGEGQSYLAAGNLTAGAEAMSWVTRTPFALDMQRVKSASVTVKAEGQADQVVAVSKEKPEDGAYVLVGMPEGRELKDEYAASRVAQGLVGVSIDDVAPASSVDMGKPDVVTQAVTFDGLKEGKRWWAFSASHSEPVVAPADEAGKAAVEAAKTTAAEINKKHAGWVYVLPEYKASVMMTKMEELLKPVEAAPPAAGPEGVMPVVPETQPLPVEAEPAPVQPPSEPAPKG